MDKLETIPLEAISIPKNHIRVQSVDEKALKKLSDSILSAGLLVRIIVRPVGKGRYELVDGERRLRAYRMLFEAEGRKWIGIPAIVEEMTPKEAISRQVAINENRKDLTPYEKAKGYKQAWETGYFKSYRDLASVVGKSHTSVIRSINIFERFPKEILQAFENGDLKQAHLQYFYSMPNRQAMRALYQAIIRNKLKSTEARELANRLDERWLSGDRELLRQIAEKDERIKDLLDEEIIISDLVNKSKCTLTYTNLSRFKRLILLLAEMVKSGEFRTTLSQNAGQ
ncbi:MAG: ParB/RepB/Spo0J family partition protein [Candidatus Euphemobacter frigidus]|nr:ParB/RepB/Spo0J family partition protein [Candidatus Euphemobacter frigidus]MDP8276299.1 ParB/RepB/Spo0J family partition protein [Candidatus Euphemobacter frigidus]